MKIQPDRYLNYCLQVEKAMARRNKRKRAKADKKRIIITPAMRCEPLEQSSLSIDMRQQAASDNDKTALLSLPAEVRNQIWEYTTANVKDVILNSTAYSRLVACTRVCRRMRQETFAMFFASNDFSVAITELKV